MIRGSCLCKKVCYVIAGPLGPISHCHCLSCRKAHAAAFGTVTRVAVNDFKIESGKDDLKSFESSAGKKRYFCSHCGSHIYAHKQGEDQYIVRLGTLDDDPGARPIRHIFVTDKAPWYDINKQLEQYDQWPG